MPFDSTSPEQPPSITVAELRKNFSEKAIDHMLKPPNMGELRAADGVGQASIACGDSMQICLSVRQDRIAEARFMTDGCGPVVACGSVTTELVKGKTVGEAMEIGEDDIMAALDGLPAAESHCAALAVSALKQALIDYLALKREPWKRTYRQIEPLTPGR